MAGTPDQQSRPVLAGCHADRLALSEPEVKYEEHVLAPHIAAITLAHFDSLKGDIRMADDLSAANTVVQAEL